MSRVQEATRAAEHFLERHQLDEAWKELEKLGPEFRAHPAVLTLRVRIFLAKGMLDWAATVGTGLVTLVPWSMPARELAAEAMERQGLLEDALALFESAPPAAFKRAVHYFHEGRLLVRLGRTEEGRERLSEAAELDGAIRARILDDETLEDIWWPTPREG